MYSKSTLSRSVFVIASLLVLPACGEDDPSGPMVIKPDTDLDPVEGDGDGDDVQEPGDGDGDSPSGDGDGDKEPEEPGNGDGDGDGDGEVSEAFKRGQKLSETYACSSCHMADYGGTAFYANITPDVATGIGGWTDEQIATAIAHGKNEKGVNMCGLMPKTALSEADMADMIAFLRGLPAVSRQITAICPGHGN